MFKSWSWRALRYPKHPYPAGTPEITIFQWYTGNGYHVPRNGVEYRAMLDGELSRVIPSKVRFRSSVPNPRNINRGLAGIGAEHKRRLDHLFSLPDIVDPKEHYVYEYLRPTDNTCFYVGCGKGHRYKDLRGREPDFKIVVEAIQRKGLQPIVNKIHENLSAAEGNRLEAQRIMYRVINGHNLVNKSFSIDGITYRRNDDSIWEQLNHEGNDK